MEIYKTKLYGTFDIDELSGEEKAIYKEVKAFAKTNPDCSDLKDLWVKIIMETGVLKKRDGYEFPHQQPLVRIYSDIELRLRIRKQEEHEKKQE